MLSLRAYARHRGCALSAVQKAIKTGRITPVDGHIDPAVADAAWSAHTRQAMPRPPGRAASAAAGPAGAIPPAAPAEEQQAPPDFNRARAIHEAYKARLAKQEYEQRSGKLLNADQVRHEVAAMISRARERLLPIGDELGPRIAEESDPVVCREMLDDKIRQALEQLAAYPN